MIRTAVTADLPELQRVYRAASLSNEGDAPLLLARPEYLVFSGDGVSEGRTRVEVEDADGGVLGFATVATDQRGDLHLDDLFVDPDRRRRGTARRLVLDAMTRAREDGHDELFVIANPHAAAFYDAAGFVDVGPADTELGTGRRMRLVIRPD
jgi:GNAT superfamily N-acetyltransferase